VQARLPAKCHTGDVDIGRASARLCSHAYSGAPTKRLAEAAENGSGSSQYSIPRIELDLCDAGLPRAFSCAELTSVSLLVSSLVRSTIVGSVSGCNVPDCLRINVKGKN
jgi:hypothetical protein